MLDPGKLLLHLLLYCGITVVICFLCRIMIKDRLLAFCACNLAGALFFFFGKILDVFSIGGAVPAWISLPAIILLCWITWKLVKHYRHLALWLNVFYMLLLCVYVVVEVVILSVNIYNDRPQKTMQLQGSKPDVYLLILDEYTSSKALRQYYRYDNHAFDTFLLAKGFMSIADSRSNYNFTVFSLASMLNREYLTAINRHRVTERDYQVAFKKLRNSYAQDLFENNGYDIKNYSYFNLRGHGALFDINIPAFGTGSIFYQTLAGKLAIFLEQRFGKKEWQKKDYLLPFRQQAHNFNLVKKEAADTGGKPKLVMMHVLAPHPPFFTDSLGRLKISGADHMRSVQKDPAAYTAYLSYFNKQVSRLVSAILDATGNGAVVILLGDHGLRKYELSSPGNEHHFMNLMAIHLPGGRPPTGKLPQSPVNLLPFVLNNVFDTKLAFQPDSAIFLSAGTQALGPVNPE